MVEDMNSVDFKLEYEDSKINTDGFIKLCAGKGKLDYSKIYIDNYVFSYLEGMIWDKHREYGSSNQTKISSKEWKRIVEGFITAKDKLQTSSTDEMQKILKFNIINPKNPIVEVSERIDEFEGFLDDFIKWVSDFIQKEKYIFIIKD